ncbi:hypothetical protein [Isoptericola sp. NPDC057391]|uniref:hypothetical protein n=1 Tax=Isoptericola sp. NPDC057391 TaxID=3346117 RepID=UPI00362CCE14
MIAPWRTAVFEGAGALLWWDLGTGASGVDVWDAPRAAAWLDAVPRQTLRRAALDAWREAWWPASRVAGVPPLDPRVLAARRATTLAALDGVTDDDTAVERVLRELAAQVARLGPLEHAAPPAGAGDEPAALAEQVRELADDYGVALDATVAPPEPAQEDYALAARGGPADGGAPLLEGSDPVDPGAVPQGVVDPWARVTWRVRLSMTLEVTVPAAPGAGTRLPVAPSAVALPAEGDAAQVAPDDGAGRLLVPLQLRGDVWRGEAPVGPTVLTRRPRLGLRVPGFTPVPGVDAAQLVAIAREVGP